MLKIKHGYEPVSRVRDTAAFASDITYFLVGTLEHKAAMSVDTSAS